MLRVVMDRLDMMYDQDRLYGVIRQILNNTTNLKAFHFQTLHEEQLFDIGIGLTAPRVTSSVESLTWKFGCNAEGSRDALHSTILGCSRSPRALSVESVDISHFTGSQLADLEFLMHLDLACWDDSEQDFTDVLQRTVITDVLTADLRLRKAQLSRYHQALCHGFCEIVYAGFQTCISGPGDIRVHHSRSWKLASEPSSLLSAHNHPSQLSRRCI